MIFTDIFFSFFFLSWDILMAYVLWTDIDLTLFLEPHIYTHTIQLIRNDELKKSTEQWTYSNTWILTRNKQKKVIIKPNPIRWEQLIFFLLSCLVLSCLWISMWSVCNITTANAILHQYIDYRSVVDTPPPVCCDVTSRMYE